MQSSKIDCFPTELCDVVTAQFTVSFIFRLTNRIRSRELLHKYADCFYPTFRTWKFMHHLFQKNLKEMQRIVVFNSRLSNGLNLFGPFRYRFPGVFVFWDWIVHKNISRYVFSSAQFSIIVTGLFLCPFLSFVVLRFIFYSLKTIRKDLVLCTFGDIFDQISIITFLLRFFHSNDSVLFVISGLTP